MVTTNDFTLYSRSDYFRQLITDIKQTHESDRVVMTTMTFDPDEPVIAELMQSLTAAAKRGVDVYLVVDAFPFILDRKIGPGPLWFNKKLPTKLREPFRSRLGSLRTLQDNGGHYAIVNRPNRAFSLPHRGRCHIKTAVINDQVYIGGCNLALPDQIDVMVGWHDQHTADWLYKWVRHIMEAGNTRRTFEDTDTELKVDDKTRLLIDAGVPGQSRIYDEALALIDAAQEWLVLTSQFFPGGRTGQHLLKARKRGVNVQIIYGHPRHHGNEALGHYAYNLRERARLPSEFFKHQLPKKMLMLHAKILATEQGTIVGSHNFASQGVRLGTAELALLRNDTQFAQNLAENVLQQLSQQGMDLARK